MRANRWPELMKTSNYAYDSCDDLLMRREALYGGKMVGREGLEPSTK